MQIRSHVLQLHKWEWYAVIFFFNFLVHGLERRMVGIEYISARFILFEQVRLQCKIYILNSITGQETFSVLIVVK